MVKGGDGDDDDDDDDAVVGLSQLWVSARTKPIT